MARNSNKQTDETPQTLPIEAQPINQPPRTRQVFHTARIVAYPINPYITKYVVLSDSKVTGMFIHNMLDNTLIPETEQFGAWGGFSKYYRSNQQDFATILKTQSADVEVVQTQADPYIAEAFIRRYSDKVSLKYDETLGKDNREPSQANGHELGPNEEYQP